MGYISIFLVVLTLLTDPGFLLFVVSSLVVLFAAGAVAEWGKDKVTPPTKGNNRCDIP